MADIFDKVATPGGDIFDQVASDEVANNIRQQLSPGEPSLFRTSRGEFRLPNPVDVASTILPQSVKQAALPIAGGLGGLALGGLTSPVTGPVGPIVGEMAGSAGGEYLNQKLGITEESPFQIGLAAAVPPAARAVTPLIRGAALGLVKTFGGRELISDIASSAAKRLFAPGTSSARLYEMARGSGVAIPTRNAQAMVDSTLIAEQKMADSPTKRAIVEALEPFQQRFASGQPIPADELIEESQRIGKMMMDAYKSGDTKLGHVLSTARKALFDDFSASGVPAFKEATVAYRKEQAIEELGAIFRSPKPINAFKKALAEDTLFSGAFSEAEKKSIEKIVDKLAGVAPSGFAGVLGRTITTGAGAKVAGPAGAILGMYVPDIISNAIATKPGRAMVEKLLTSPGEFGTAKMAVLAQFVRAQNATSPEAIKDFRDAMRDADMSFEEKMQRSVQRAEELHGLGQLGGAAKFLK